MKHCSHHKVLVISPDAFSNQLMVRILEVAGYSCLLSMGSVEAMEDIRRFQVPS